MANEAAANRTAGFVGSWKGQLVYQDRVEDEVLVERRPWESLGERLGKDGDVHDIPYGISLGGSMSFLRSYHQ